MNIKLLLGIGLLILVVIFTLQNTQVMTISFLFWTVTLSRALIIFVVLAIGVIVGWILSSLMRPKKQE